MTLDPRTARLRGGPKRRPSARRETQDFAGRLSSLTIRVAMARDISLVPQRGGREEIRAAELRAPLLRLREEKGQAALTDVLSEAGLQLSELGHDSAWVPLASARRILDKVIELLGEDAVSTRGARATSPDVLGLYMRLLRHARTLREGYEYLVHNASESNRVGNFHLLEIGATTAKVSYVPQVELELDQSARSLCLLRQAELKALPRLWGLDEADLVEHSCLARGQDRCVYQLRWQGIERPYWPLAAVSVGIGAGGLAGAFGSMPAAGIAALAGALLGGTSGSLLSRLRRERAERNRERHRVIALEQNLKQRGQLEPHAADLTDAVLGGKYRMLRPIATGGIGTVYAAEHLGVGYQVAVKVLRGAAAVDAAEVARLRREARIQMALEHPNIIRTFDLDQLPDGTLYVVMELLRGISLQEKLRQKGALAASYLIPVLLQTCRALAAAHRQGIVHRDLKPGNVFLCEGGAVKVLDFGMSKLGQGDALTQDGYTLGTPEYMSPEQCSGGEVDRRSDIYAFGVLSYEALTGTLPFRSSSRRALLEQHQRVIPKPMRKVRPDLDIPEELDQVILSCLAKRPDDRPDGAEQLERALAMIPSKRALGGYDVDADPSDSKPPSSDRE